MVDIETGRDGEPLDFRLRDVRIARSGGLPLHPGELVSMWDRDLELGAGEPLLAVMQRAPASTDGPAGSTPRGPRRSDGRPRS